jgi:hypothetical protein
MRTLTTLASLSIVFTFLGCGGGGDEETISEPNTAETTADVSEAAPQEAPATTALATLDLSEAGIKASIQAPEGATAVESYGSAEIKVGDGSSFYLEINSGAPDMAEVIQFWKDNTMQKLKTTHVETDDVLIVETDAYGTISFWLDANVSVGDEAYHCRSGRGAPIFDRAQIDAFLTACQSLSAL